MAAESNKVTTEEVDVSFGPSTLAELLHRYAKPLQVLRLEETAGCGVSAIRESNNFCGPFGVVDNSAFIRMAAVHETEALKDVISRTFRRLRRRRLMLSSQPRT